MVNATPQLSIPYAEDDDPRGLYPTTDQDKAERLEELLSAESAQAQFIGAVDAGGATVAWNSLNTGAGGTWWTISGDMKTITYHGPDRRIAFMLHMRMTANDAMDSACQLGATPGSAGVGMVSQFQTDVGPFGQAVHTHRISTIGWMGPSYFTTLVLDARADITGGLAADSEATLELHPIA
jgi:hypothetical protein